MAAIRSGARPVHCEPGEIGRGAELTVGRRGGLQLQRRALFVAEAPAGRPGELARPRRVVRSLGPLQEIERAAQRAQRRLGRAVGELDRPARLRRHRHQRVGVEAPRRRFQLAAGTLCALRLAGRQHDLDAGRQQPRAPEAAGGGAEGTADRRGGGVDASFRQPQQGQPGLRVEPAAARAPVRPLGRRELAPQAVHLGLLVECRGHRSPRGSLGAFAGTVRLLDRAMPVAVQQPDLGAMHAADPGERGEVGLAPARQGGGPLACTADRVNRHAGLDDAQYIRPVIINDSSPAVTATMTSSSSASPSWTRPCSTAYQALLVTGAGDQVGVAAALADIGGPRRAFVGSLPLAGGDVFVRHGDEHVALLGALILALQQSLAAGEPAGRAAHLSTEEQLEAEPERTADGAVALVAVQVSLVGAFEGPQVVVVPADQIRRHRQQLEIAWRQIGGLIGARQHLKGVGPFPPLVVLATAFEAIGAVRATLGRITGAGLAHFAPLRKLRTGGSFVAGSLFPGGGKAFPWPARRSPASLPCWPGDLAAGGGAARWRS